MVKYGYKRFTVVMFTDDCGERKNQILNNRIVAAHTPTGIGCPCRHSYRRNRMLISDKGLLHSRKLLPPQTERKDSL